MGRVEFGGKDGREVKDLFGLLAFLSVASIVDDLPAFVLGAGEATPPESNDSCAQDGLVQRKAEAVPRRGFAVRSFVSQPIRVDTL